MEHTAFYVFERPQVYWDWELRRKNLEFLQGVDPRYYEYVVETNVAELEGESKLQAAAALRIAYMQGLETLFALICAAMQAPDCVVGWMQSYRSGDLRGMVSGICSHPRPNVLPGFRPPTWDSMAIHVGSFLPWDDAKKDWVAKGFGRAWSRFAREWLDERNIAEYNALKHGSRPRLGGFTFSLGIQPELGVPAPTSRVRRTTIGSAGATRTATPTSPPTRTPGSTRSRRSSACSPGGGS